MDWGQLGIETLSYLLPIVAAVLSALSSWALVALKKKWNLEVDITTDAAIRTSIRAAIAGAEEWAARKMKAEGKPAQSASKAKWAWDTVSKVWPKLKEGDFAELLDQELALMMGVGATGNKIVGDTPDMSQPTTGDGGNGSL